MLGQKYYLVQYTKKEDDGGEVQTQLDLKWSFKDALETAKILTTQTRPVDVAWVVGAAVVKTGETYAVITRPQED